jgi:hypothetical protein
METLHFAGGYEDAWGQEPVAWRVVGSSGYIAPVFEISTTVRGVDLSGPDFDSLEPVDAAIAAGGLSLGSAGELTECILSGELPCAVTAGYRG